MLGRRVLAAAAVAAALLPSTATASGDVARPCRIVFDPRTFYTPAGPVTVPIPYCVNP